MKSPIVAALAGVLAAFVVVAPPAEASSRQSALRVLNSLPVVAEASSGYSRNLFRHWIDADGNGCDAREEVLIAERLTGDVVACDVVGGRWRSAYDGVSTTDPGSFDIDHRVPLKEAWDSGAWRWNAATRQDFANDLGYPQGLIAVSAGSNRSKGDRDPAEWMPPLASQRCTYAKQWIAVKFRWRLAVDSSEKSFLGGVLRSCPSMMLLPDLAATSTDPNAVRPTSGSTATPGTGGGAGAGVDPRFATCGAANAAGYGPYIRGHDPEYSWYIDRDGDGRACEP